MRLVIDMNLTPRWVEHLNGAGYDGSADTGDARESGLLLRDDPLMPDLRGGALLQTPADCEEVPQ